MFLVGEYQLAFSGDLPSSGSKDTCISNVIVTAKLPFKKVLPVHPHIGHEGWQMHFETSEVSLTLLLQYPVHTRFQSIVWGVVKLLKLILMHFSYVYTFVDIKTPWRPGRLGNQLMIKIFHFSNGNHGQSQLGQPVASFSLKTVRAGGLTHSSPSLL